MFLTTTLLFTQCLEDVLSKVLVTTGFGTCFGPGFANHRTLIPCSAALEEHCLHTSGAGCDVDGCFTDRMFKPSAESPTRLIDGSINRFQHICEDIVSIYLCWQAP